MSSILEALERAELERNARETVPLLESVSRPKPLWLRRKVWLTAAGLLLLNLLVWWFMIDRGDTPRVAKVPQAQATFAPRPAATPKPSPQVQKSPQVTASQTPPKVNPPPITQAVLPAKPVTTAPAKAARVNVPPLLEAVVTPAPTPMTPVSTIARVKPAAIIPVVEPHSTSVVAAGVESVPVFETPEPMEPPVSPPVVEQQSGAETPKGSTPLEDTVPDVSTTEPIDTQVAEVADEAVVEKVEQIPRVWELPPDAQQKLQDLKINIHVYNDIPAERFVIINMRRYREGDALPRAGLKLEKITREGVIINYGKGKVKM